MPLGILPKNEDEMVEIMDYLHQYVPSATYQENRVISTGERVTVERANLHLILIGGDQLTAARARSAKKSESKWTNAS